MLDLVVASVPVLAVAYELVFVVASSERHLGCPETGLLVLLEHVLIDSPVVERTGNRNGRCERAISDEFHRDLLRGGSLRGGLLGRSFFDSLLGNRLWYYSNAPYNNAIACFSGSATLKTSTPSADNDCAPKKYVDDSIPVVFTGADGTNAGTAGLVKAPAATDNTKFLKGDGTWSDIPTELPSQTSQSGKFLITNGTTASWANVPSPNDATLTIQLNGTTVETFSANASTNKTANIQATQVVWRKYTTT